MRELSYHKLKDGRTVTLSVRWKALGDVYTVAWYSKGDIEERSDEYENADEAWREYSKAKADV